MEAQIASLVSHLRAVWKYRWYAQTFAWLMMICGITGVFLLPDKYTASARVYVDTQSTLKPLLSGMTSVPNVEQQVAIMGRTLLSRPNIERLVRMVDLDIKTNTTREKETLIEELTKQIILTGSPRDNIYTITYTHHDPKLAKEVVSSLLTIFIEGGIGDKKMESQRAVSFIEEQIKEYEEKLANAENMLKDFKLKNSGLLSRNGGDYSSKLMEAIDVLSQARLELREAEKARDVIRQSIGIDQHKVSANVRAAVRTTSSFDERIQAQQRRLDELQLQFTAEHPDVISTRRLLAQLQEKRQEELSHTVPNADPGANYSPMLQQLTIALATAESRVASLQARVEEYAARAKRLSEMNQAVPTVEAELAQLNRDYEINKENYEKLLSRRVAAKLSGELTATTDMITFRIVDPPSVPPIPTGPNRMHLFMAVVGIAIGGGIALAFFISRLRPTFLTSNTLQLATGLPVLGTVAMQWGPQDLARQRRGTYVYIGTFILLLLSTTAVGTRILLMG